MDQTTVRAWSGLELVKPLSGGARNPVFLARRYDEPFVVRISARPEPSLEWELQLLDYLSSHGFGVPETVSTDDGRRHNDGVLLQRFIDGRPPAAADEWKTVVGELVRLHQATHGWPQRPGFASIRDLMSSDFGGDVNFGAMPADAVDAIRAAWQPILEGELCATHADVGAGNLLVNDRKVIFLDWDEARVDVPWLDFAYLPAQVDVPLPYDRATLTTAGVAWEAATCWLLEPDYAAQRLAELRQRLSNPFLSGTAPVIPRMTEEDIA